MELQQNEELYEEIVGQRQKPLLTHMSKGIRSMRKFVTSLLKRRNPDIPEHRFIKQYLTPSMKDAHTEFKAVQKLAMKMKRATDEQTEKLVDDYKDITDDLRNTECKQSQNAIEIKGKKEEIKEAKERLEKKQKRLSAAKRTLSKSESELEKRKDNQDKAAVGSLGMSGAALPALLIPGAGPFIALGLAAGGAATAVVAVTAMEKAIKEQRGAVSDCKDEVKTCKTQLNNAEENKDKLDQQKLKLRKKHKSLQTKLNDISKQKKELKRLQIELAEWNEILGKCVHSLTLFYGRVKVLHLEVVDGYMTDVLMKPTKDVCSSFLSLMQCRGFCHVCGTEDNSNMIDMTQKMEGKLNEAIENRCSEIEDMV